ncbi:helix-turn-helix domain-containing protein [Intestinibacter bartlettii]|uniref:helix-turn-helix domain-containing protein n=1 Tax=Intestinibacter bartlettii TaxID=261299 RepID=UPI00399FC8C0
MYSVELIKEFVKNNFKKEKYNVEVIIDDISFISFDSWIRIDKYDENLNISSQDFDMSIELDNVVKIDGDKDTGKIETKSGKIISYTMLYRPWLKDIDKIFTFAEAAEKWRLDTSTLRKLVLTDKVEIGDDVKKSGKVWLITGECMHRLYGKPQK